MFWSRKGGVRRGRWSIVSRLMTLYACSTILVLGSLSVSLHWILADNLESSDIVFLKNEIKSIANILKLHVGDWNALNQELVWAPESQDNDYYARVLLPSGDVIIETPNMQSIFPPSIWPPAKLGEANLSRAVFYVAPSQKAYLLMSQWVDLHNKLNQKFLVQVALDVSRDQLILLRYGHDLIVVSVIALWLSLVLGYWVAKKGLSPLRSMATQVEKISASRLNTRINTTRWPQELTQLAESFNNMLEKVERAFEELSAFSSNLAHEVRTPINNLIGETELVLRSKRSIREYQDVLGSNLEEFGRLSRIVERLLFLARAENNHMSLQPVEVNLKEEFEAIMDFHQAVAQEKSITLMGAGEGHLKADVTLFRRALNNLVSNALKYTPEHGKVELRTESIPGFIRISVSDNGVGIPEADLPKVFNRFYRVDHARSKHSGGTGLGLAIVKSIVQLHRGKIGIESQVGVGTRVFMDWPVDL